MSEDTIFSRGIFFKDPSDKAPSYVIGKVKFKVDEAIEFINEHAKDGWLTLDIKRSKGGKTYMQVDTYVPSNKQQDSPGQSSQVDEAPY